jgi:putative membrane protein
MIRWFVLLKGFAMGAADIVPGVSGGTVAFITGIYDELLESIARVDKTFVKLLFSFKIKEALEHVNYKFIIPLLVGAGECDSYSLALYSYPIK